jgi:4-amino-4-deoxy-L-arabinose transferase-like glycosyltransferase
MTNQKILLGLVIASMFLWLIALGNLPLRDWDEGTYAIVAREIYRTGNWLYPTLQGEAFMLKPPLMQWLIALCYHLGGVQEFTTRFPGAFLTALGVPLLYLVGNLVFTEKISALFSALVYLTLLPVVRHGRLAMLDGMILTFFLLLFFCILKAREQRKYALGIGFCLGLITLTKGTLVLVLALMSGLFIIANKQLSLLKNPFFWLGMFFGNLPAVAWYLCQWQHYGNNFLAVHFASQAFDRLATSVEGNTGPIWYYLLEVIKYSFPWLLFVPGGLYLAWKNRHHAWGSLILICTIVYFTIISFMKTKLPWYVIPVYPFLALAIGKILGFIWQHNKIRNKFFIGFFIFISIVGVAGCIYFLKVDRQPLLVLMSIILMLTMGIVSWLIQNNNRNFITVLFAGMYLVLVLLMSSQSWIWELNEAFPVKPIASLINQNIPPGTKIYTSFGYHRPSLDFYSDCQVVPASLEMLQEMLSKTSYLLVDNDNLQKLNVNKSKVIGTDNGWNLIAS